jgi:hypothetical protein
MFVPHDLVKYSELMGTGFYGHLNELFSTNSGTTGRDQADITGTIGSMPTAMSPATTWPTSIAPDLGMTKCARSSPHFTTLGLTAFPVMRIAVK